MILLYGSFSGCKKSPSSQIWPYARFSADKTIVETGDTIWFFNESGNATSYLWDFGDGSSSAEENPHHVYEDPGKYIVVLDAERGDVTSKFSIDILVKNLTVMTYNIAIGGGVVQEVLDIARAHGHTEYLSNRIPEILTVIREVDPDILGIQEALLWDYFDPPYYRQFADSLGMEHLLYLEHEEAEFNGICIYSKFPIESYSFQLYQPCKTVEWNGAAMVRAVIRIDSETTMDVYVCHISPHHGEESTSCQLEAISDTILNNPNPLTILMGDMNFGWIEKEETFPQFLFSADLHCLLSGDESEVVRGVDMIWASEPLYNQSRLFNYYTVDKIFDQEILQLLPEASDHYPVIAYFGF